MTKSKSSSSILTNNVEKEFDEITEVAKRGGASWLPYLVWDAEWLKGSISKFFDEDTAKALAEKVWATVWDIVFFAAGSSVSWKSTPT